MPANPYYFPSRDADITPWLANFSARLTAAPGDFGLIAGDAVLVAAQNTLWIAAIALATNPGTRTPVTVAGKDAVKATMKSVVLPYAVLIASNPAVLDEDKVLIGVTVRVLTRSAIAPPNFAPGLDLVAINPLQVTLRYYDLGAPSVKALPYGSIGVQVAQVVQPTVASDPDAAPIVRLVSRAPFTMTHTSGQVGKIATTWGRFQMRSRGDGTDRVGPWSTALSYNVS